jgi:homopolymeric O-antigen transport system ATP-binding protein
MPPIIEVENLSKCYRLGQFNARTLREEIERLLQRVGGSAHGKAAESEFWALRDVSFSVEAGEVVGIIGRNGAGKSTLLKILSRVTEPTGGSARLRGRVASLLEVGTGFHPELTGRENIYLNGAILGMTRAEIRRKFDEIVDFSGVEKFLDTPVKRYSSGMYVRLAFAVAAHLEPEILIVDEVLSVGDAEFQKKCLGKMADVASGGRTVLFVSHNLAAIENLCGRAAVLEKGHMICVLKTVEAIQRYISTIPLTGSKLRGRRPDWAKPCIKGAHVIGPSGTVIDLIRCGEPLSIQMKFSDQDNRKLANPVMGVVVHHLTFGTVGAVDTRITGFSPAPLSSGIYTCTIEDLPLLQGYYTVDVWLGDGADNVDVLEAACSFTVIESDVYGTGRVPYPHLGVMMFKPVWRLKAA